MQKNNFIFFILAMFLIVPQRIHTFPSGAEAAESVKNAFTSPFAFQVYATILAGVGQHVVMNLADPGLYQFRKKTNALTPQEKQIDIMYQKQLLELQEARFNLIAAQRQIILEGWESYKKNIQKKITHVSNSELPEEEKNKQIESLKKKLDETKIKKNEQNNQLFEQMLKQAGIE